MDCLTQDGFADVGAEGVGRHEVDPTSDKPLKAALQLEESEQTHRVSKIHEEIDVAIGLGFAPRR